MADAAASVLSLHTRSMPLLAHLEELRKRIIFSVLAVLVGFISCWSFADRIFGLMQQPNYWGAASPRHRRRVGVPKPN